LGHHVGVGVLPFLSGATPATISAYAESKVQYITMLVVSSLGGMATHHIWDLVTKESKQITYQTLPQRVFIKLMNMSWAAVVTGSGVVFGAFVLNFLKTRHITLPSSEFNVFVTSATLGGCVVHTLLNIVGHLIDEDDDEE